MSLSNKKVLIVGAGITGLLLAQGLKKNSIPYEIFERDESEDARFQGWSFSIHFALPYVEQLLEEEHFSRIGVESAANPKDSEGRGLTLLNGLTGEVAFRIQQQLLPKTEKVQHYRVNRNRFRKFLSYGINVQYNKQFKEYKITEEGVTIIFEDGTEAKGDVLVGADGVSSRVCRQLRGGDFAIPLPVQMINYTPVLTEEEYKKFYEITPTHMLATGPKNGEDGQFVIFFSILDVDIEKNLYVVFWSISWWNKSGSLPVPELNEDRIQLAKKIGQQLCEPLRSLILNTPNDATIHTLNVRERAPVPWDGQGKVTLIGDAAHAMTMFRGEAGNHGMQDCAELTAQLVSVHQGTKSLEKALSDYLENMIPRTTEAVEGSHKAAVDAHSSPEYLLNMRPGRPPIPVKN